MLKPPSLQNEFDIWYSGDPAFHLPADAKEAARLVRQCRETGDISPILIGGETPTFFTVKPLRSSVFRKIVDRVSSGTLGQTEAAAIAFRSTLIGVKNFGDVEIRMVKDEAWGTLAAPDIADMLDARSPSIVSELGGLMLDRAVSPDPK